MFEDLFSRRHFGSLAARLAAFFTVGAGQLGTAQPAAAGTGKGPLPSMKASLYHFSFAPFPYQGIRPDTGAKFLDVSDNGRVGHTAPRGGVYFQDQTYSDNRVLVAVPAGFDLGKKAAIVVFFHGNQSTLERDVIGRQHVLDQLQDSTLNAALIAPQFAFDALDSSAGRFWQDDAFARFMGEAAIALGDLIGARDTKAKFAKLPIILVAFSGGYNPAAYAITVGGVGKRMMGLVLLDALYAETDRFVTWIQSSRRAAFFLSAFSEASEEENDLLERKLHSHKITYSTDPPEQFLPGSVSFMATPGVVHEDYVTKAWVDDPLTWVFDRIPGLQR